MKHGTASKYNHDRCRCDLCREAWNAHCRAKFRRINAEARALREAAEAAGQVYVTARNVTHGKTGTYLTYGCRCDPCRAAHGAYQRDWKRRKQARKP